MTRNQSTGQEEGIHYYFRVGDQPDSKITGGNADNYGTIRSIAVHYAGSKGSRVHDPLMRSALYYPHIHVGSERPLQAIILCVPTVEPIFPDR